MNIRTHATPLGRVSESQVECKAEIKNRIAMAKNAFNKSRELFSKILTKELKKKVIMAIIGAS